MAHYNQLNFIKTVANALMNDWKGVKILEIGSFEVNDSIRPFFQESDYIGVDLCAGKGVDVVASGETLDYPDKSFALVISCESFEHNPQWAKTFQNMHRMTEDGGIVLFTCATTGRLEHGTNRTIKSDSPGTQSIGWNYYKNLTKRDFEKFHLEVMFHDYLFLENKWSNDLYFVGIKGGKTNFTFDKNIIANKLMSMNSIIVRDRKFGSYFFRSMKKGFDKLLQFLPDRIYQNIKLYPKKLKHKIKKL